MDPRETANNAYAKFWGDKQRALWYVMVFLEWSIEPFHLHFHIHIVVLQTTKENMENPSLCMSLKTLL